MSNFTKGRKTSGNPLGIGSWCYSCKRESNNNYANRNRDKVREANRKYDEKIASLPYRKCYKCEEIKTGTEFSLRNRICKKCAVIRQREERYKRYGMTKQEFDALALKQGGEICAICGYQPSFDERPLCIDHNHETGKVRGLICNPCNTGIGRLKDSVTLLMKAAAYLLSNELDDTKEKIDV